MNGNAVKSLKKRYIGDKAFYRLVLTVMIPIMIQNAFGMFVNMLDNVMVGRLGTDPMTGVSIVNQLMFVFNLTVFGGMSGAGIFAAQYSGAGDEKGIRYCFRYKLYLSLLISAVAMLVFSLAGTPLIGLYLNEEGAAGRVASTLGYGMDYLKIMIWGLAPFVLASSYASTLRETGETRLPMIAGVASVIVNCVLNLVLIYGYLGLPAMGVKGAALATVISRFTELGIVAVTAHMRTDRYSFLKGVYRTLYVPLKLVKRITIKGMPLLVNECLWSIGMAAITRCYSLGGLDIVTALNISTTVSNLFGVVFHSMGNATAILLGQVLGAGDYEKARLQATHLIAFSVMIGACSGILMTAAAPFAPLVYNTEAVIRSLATKLIVIYACCMPLYAYCNCTYFILRSGGKTALTLLFDSGFTWCVSLPIAWGLVSFTGLAALMVYLIVQLAEFLKCLLSGVLVHKGVWIQNIVEK